MQACNYQNLNLVVTKVSKLKSKANKHIFLFKVCHCVVPLFDWSILGKSHSQVCSEMNFFKYVICIKFFLIGQSHQIETAHDHRQLYLSKDRPLWVEPLSQHLFVGGEIKFSAEIFYWSPKQLPKRKILHFSLQGTLLLTINSHNKEKNQQNI